MILKETLRKIVRLQKEGLAEAQDGMRRAIQKSIAFDIPYAIILSGIRRCGKSTLLRHLMKRARNPYYFNFEDPRALHFEVTDFEKLDEVLLEEFGISSFYFFDEIQNVPRWELIVRKLLDSGKRCIVTGSNASLLSKELGTKLTGRHLTYELFPFSYRETGRFASKKPSAGLSLEYLNKGGFPDVLKYEETTILQELFTDIIARDIVVRHRLREAKTIAELAIYLLTNAGKEFSYNKLATYLHLGSPNTVISYISFLEESYLLFTIPKFDYSYKRRLVNPKKAYCIDTGLANANTVSFSSDRGRALENLVFLHLRRSHKSISYFKGTKECDFIVEEKNKPVAAFQVCYDLNEENSSREIEGLREAMKACKLDQGTIITFDQEDRLGEISIIPFWKWASKACPC